MQVSIKDIAAQAGVSVATASRALSDHPGLEVAQSTRDRIRRFAVNLGYEPNRLARGLQARSTKIIGVLIGDIRNPYFAGMLEIAEDLAITAGYQVIADTTIRSAQPLAKTRFDGWPLDGVLMWATSNTTAATILRREQLPTVYMGYTRPDNADYVALDRFGGAKDLVNHLIGQGYRRIAYLTPDAAGVATIPDDRLLGYTQACDENGIEPWIISPMQPGSIGSISVTGGRRSDGFAAGVELAELPEQERPEAIFCYNDVIALGMREGLLSAGLRIPSDIALAGCDGIEEGLYLSKPLTSIETPVDLMCRTAIRFLVERMTGGADKPPQQIVLPTSLRIGGTT
ncbi:MAG: LacI family DNA-binding transcriptional regulator [Capsulimonadaceae bacterium]|nr:LacI family DNA-binding transcriptional regulator [Capsulimonadaceae bacterium]